MLLFSGGFTKRQIQLLLNNDDIIFEKVPYDEACCHPDNTFDYIPKNMINIPIDKFREYVSDDCYEKQYIFFSKYLIGALEFCKNTSMQNFILVCEIDSKIIDPYIGVGDYKDGNYRIEYRVPRKLINSSNILDILFYEPYDEDQLKELEKKYINDFYVPSIEKENAKKLIKRNGLLFNRDKFN